MLRKRINIILLTVAFFVWMIIFYNIVFSDNEKDRLTEKYVKSEFKNNKEDTLGVNYPLERQKDPFITPFNHRPFRPELANKSEKKVTKDESPKLYVLGIMKDRQGSMAIIGFPDEIVHFVKEKQKINDIEIVRINNKKVLFKFKKKLHTITFNN